MTAEEIKALIEGHKELGSFYTSPHKISPDDSGVLLTEPKSSGKKPHVNKKPTISVAEARKRFEERKAKSDYPELNSNLGFI